jgi:hypothetical protein
MNYKILNMPASLQEFVKKKQELIEKCRFLSEDTIKTFMWKGLTDEEIFEFNDVAREEIVKDLI